MAAEEEKRNDFYGVLGLKKECSAADLKIAYKTLAMKWHPDRCSASGNSKNVEDAKNKFQAIQQAYSVLSDTNKRFLYDVGVYDCDDDEDENGMGDFLNEMASMMTQNKSSGNRDHESFEDLQELFEGMFQSDLDVFASSSSCSCSSSSLASSGETYNFTNKRNSSEISSRTSSINAAEPTKFGGFCFGVENQEYTRKGRGTGVGTQGRGGSSKRRDGRKQKVSFGHDVSSYNDYSTPSFS